MAKEKFKPDLSKLSINQLQELTGSSYRTVKKRLAESFIDPVSQDGSTLFYDPKIALPIIFEAQGVRTRGFSPEDPEDLDPDERDERDPALQNARLAKARTEKINIEIDVLKGKLIPAEEVEQEWSDLIVAFRSQIMSIPPRYSPILLATKDPREFEIKLRNIIKDALTQLANYTPGQNEEEESEEVEADEADPTPSE